jgi:hypothetical protein
MTEAISVVCGGSLNACESFRKLAERTALLECTLLQGLDNPYGSCKADSELIDIRRALLPSIFLALFLPSSKIVLA